MDRLRLFGASLATSAADVATRCRRILLSLPGPSEVAESVAAIEPWLVPGDFILDTTTGDPELVESIAERLAKKGIFWLDAEIGGAGRQVADGEAIVVCGGRQRPSDLAAIYSTRSAGKCFTLDARVPAHV